MRPASWYSSRLRLWVPLRWVSCRDRATTPRGRDHGASRVITLGDIHCPAETYPRQVHDDTTARRTRPSDGLLRRRRRAALRAPVYPLTSRTTPISLLSSAPRRSPRFRRRPRSTREPARGLRRNRF